MDFEDILKYFRVSMPKKYLDEEEYKKLINSALGFRVSDLFVILVSRLSLSITPSWCGILSLSSALNVWSK